MSNPSAIGNLADFAAGQVLLPAFVLRRDDGLYIDLPAIDSRNLFAQFVERVFGAGARFVDLDYELFLNLAFRWEAPDIEHTLEEYKRKGKEPRPRIARDIVPFGEERRAIYRGVKILEGGKSAEYLFEQVSVEREVEDPEAADGSGQRKESERLYPDFDEFVAALWEKGVRYGIDAKAVREAIARDKAERLVIAQANQPANGKDASVDEQTDLIHRDDAPRILSNGRMDLRHYRNRFPQVNGGTRLFKKVPRLAGHSGWDVQGKELPPTLVKDFDIGTLAGPGTQVVREAAGEFVVAAIDGFLDIDVKSGQISVIDKIISREGVSMRTTGDLSLSGEEYEEHGEVQERRVVEGHNMCFLADVFGNIVSAGGCITLKQCLSGGTAHSPGGRVVIEGSASRSLVEALNGEVVINRAESCLIIAARVRIAHAINCDIVAEEIDIENAEGCAMAAKRVALTTATTRKDDATVVTLLLPDMDAFARREQTLREVRTAALAEKDGLSREIKTFTEQPDMRSYMALQPKIKAGSLVMNPKQVLQWQELLTRLAPLLRQLSARNIALKAAYQRIADADAELAEAAQARKEALAAVSCAIGTVAGDTLVRRVHIAFDAPPLTGLAPKDLHKRLRGLGVAAAPLFSGASGSFQWQPPQAEVPAEQVPAEQVPAEQVPAEQVPAEQVPAEQVPAEQVPAEGQ